mmetsp:Transcript_52126/g.114410  ORF Transcript_52126/g.114410 Transcript_52126/m.114410 type:complete len:260 (+) Transcript_52126:2236-3015(+)
MLLKLLIAPLLTELALYALLYHLQQLCRAHLIQHLVCLAQRPNLFLTLGHPLLLGFPLQAGWLELVVHRLGVCEVSRRSVDILHDVGELGAVLIDQLGLVGQVLIQLGNGDIRLQIRRPEGVSGGLLSLLGLVQQPGKIGLDHLQHTDDPGGASNCRLVHLQEINIITVLGVVILQNLDCSLHCVNSLRRILNGLLIAGLLLEAKLHRLSPLRLGLIQSRCDINDVFVQLGNLCTKLHLPSRILLNVRIRRLLCDLVFG